jgi:hypothetical protein
MQPALIWRSLGVTEQFLKQKAAWLSEPRELEDQVISFFIEAGKLVSFSWYHYPFSSLALFQSIIAMEKSLRLFNRNPKLSFQVIFAEIADQAVVSDSAFSVFELSSPDFEVSRIMKKGIKRNQKSHLGLLSTLIPKLRNDFFHGNYLMSPAFLPLCFQMRELADALCPEIQRRIPRAAGGLILRHSHLTP